MIAWIKSHWQAWHRLRKYKDRVYYKSVNDYRYHVIQMTPKESRAHVDYCEQQIRRTDNCIVWEHECQSCGKIWNFHDLQYAIVYPSGVYCPICLGCEERRQKRHSDMCKV